MRQDEARLAEAYETLYDECRLQTYLDHHPSEVDSNEEELDNAGQGNDEEQEEEQQQEADGAISATDAEDSEEEVAEGSSRISPSDNGNDDLDKSEESKDLFEEGWTRSEVSTFFTSLGRRSRLFPDLISRDLKHSKSTSQVAHLLALLKQKACSGEESSKGLTLKGTTQASSKTLGKRRRIEKMKAAHEVSDDWLAFEEKMAGRLRVWQQAEDMEDFTTATPARDSKDGCVTWDEQVLNVLLFLRHHPLISPDANAANTTYDVPLSVLSSQDAAEQRIFSFAAKIVPSLLGLKERSYLMFAKVHPVPSTRRKNSTNTEAVKEDLESLAAKVLFRGAELGIIAWVEVDGFGSGEELPQARLLKNSKSWPSSLPEGRLVWLDTVINHRDSKAASVMLDQVREAAAHRILNNLRWSEARTLAEYFGNAGSEEVNDETSTTTATNPIQSPSQLLQDVERLTRAGSEYKGWVDGYLAQANYSSLTYPERNRLRSRVHRRIQLFGIEKALAMPLEAQTAGRKRKAVGAVDEQVNGDPAQEVEEFDLHEEQAQQTVVPRPSTRPPTSWLEDTREGKATSMTPFKQAGVGPALVKRLLRSASQDVFLLLNMSKLKNIAQLQLCQAAFPAEQHDLPIDRISQQTLATLHDLLKSFVSAVVASSLEFASLTESKWITVEHVKSSLSQQRQREGINKNVQGLDPFRSDPPRQYQANRIRLHEIQLQLQGLRKLSSTRSMLDSTFSVIKDVVISPSDVFVLPISSTFAPVQQATMRKRRSSARREETECEEEEEDAGIDVAAAAADEIDTSEEEEDGDVNDDDDDDSSVFDDSDQEREIQMRKEEGKGVIREVDQIDGRIWEYNQKREEEESKRWKHVEEMDRKKARRHERNLWAAVGLIRDVDDDVVKSNTVQKDQAEIIVSSDTGEDQEEGEVEEEEQSLYGSDIDEEMRERRDDDGNNNDNDDDSNGNETNSGSSSYQ